MKGTSKIATLPRNIREELNQRLDVGQTHASMAAWLNSIPEVEAILKERFNGEPISRQNVTTWKKSGFLHWQMRQEALSFTQDSVPDNLDDPALEK